jgi:hypothetical protein
LLTAVAAGTTFAGLIVFASQLVVITEQADGRTIALIAPDLDRVKAHDAEVG